MMKIDPNSPSLIGILKGKKGRDWQLFAWSGITFLAGLNIIEVLTVLHAT